MDTSELSATEPVRIFVNATPLDARRGEPVIEAIARWDDALASTLKAGERALADNRGLVTPLDTVVYGGAIFRVVSNRQLRADDRDDDPYADVDA
jgi:hypothetical protein